MSGHSHQSSAGFTLIELVIVVVVLGILAAIAIPRYQDLNSEARESACRGALGDLRSAIVIYFANQALKTGVASWPPADSLLKIGVVMFRGIPPNPFRELDLAPDSIVVANVNKGVTVGQRGGWVYNERTGEIWPNSATSGENIW